MNKSVNEEGVCRAAPGFARVCLLDGAGPIDNSPSINKLHYIVRKKMKKWHGTYDTWHITCDMWHVVGGEHSLKVLAP